MYVHAYSFTAWKGNGDWGYLCTYVALLIYIHTYVHAYIRTCRQACVNCALFCGEWPHGYSIVCAYVHMYVYVHTFNTCTLCKPLPLMKAAEAAETFGISKKIFGWWFPQENPVRTYVCAYRVHMLIHVRGKGAWVSDIGMRQWCMHSWCGLLTICTLCVDAYILTSAYIQHCQHLPPAKASQSLQLQ